MKRLAFRFGLGFATLLMLAPLCARAKDHHYLSSAEVEKLRDTQNPSDRIKVYLSFEAQRLTQIEVAYGSNGDTRLNLKKVLHQYISIDNEMKDWIQYQYDHDGDMRKGLKHLLHEGPRQLEVLRHFQSSSGSYARQYSRLLGDAIADMNDTLNGATEALAEQQKKFPAMKESAKAEARSLKKEQKEQKKLNKKERKLRNRQRKHDQSNNSGQN